MALTCLSTADWESATSGAKARLALTSFDRLHREFREEPIGGLSTLVDRNRLLSPNALRAERDDSSPIPAAAIAGWESFPDLVPPFVADAVLAVLEEPAILADPFSDAPARSSTAMHTSQHRCNRRRHRPHRLGRAHHDRPPAVEFAYFLVMRHHHATIDATHDELCADYRAIAGGDFDERAFTLAMFGSLVMFGWSMALRLQLARSDTDRDVAARNLEYWCDWTTRARRWWRPR